MRLRKMVENVNSGLVDNVGTFEEFVSAHYPTHRVIDYFVDHQTFKNNQTFVPPGMKPKNANISLDGANLEGILELLLNVNASSPQSISPVLTNFLSQMTASDLNSLISELSLIMTHQGYKNFKSNLV